MNKKLISLYNEYKNLKEKLYETQDINEIIKINKELSNLEEIAKLYEEYQKVINNINEAKKILENETDEELIKLAKIELKENEDEKIKLEEKIKIALLPKDPNDERNIYLEIRPAAGGEEAALFAQDLLRMYLRYAEKKGRKTEIQDMQLSDLGGIKFVNVRISGEKVYSKLKFEAGVHRVQRIPVTESSGRIHTSTVTVAVIPEVDDIEIEIKPEEIEIDTYAASSAGGQHANKNETGVRIHHKPTGIIVNVNDSRSQLQNKEKAFRILKSKLYQLKLEEQQKQLKEQRLSQIGTGDRSEKIRTYNYPQDRITDHRIKTSWGNIQEILDGNLDQIIEALINEEQILLLSNQENDE